MMSKLIRCMQQAACPSGSFVRAGGAVTSFASGRLKSNGNFREHDPRINYFVKGEPVQNFGDYLPELLAKEFMLHPRVDADIYRLIGSVIESSWILRDLRHTIGIRSGHVVFWCCGMRQDMPLEPKVQELCSFFGTRGPLTRDLLGLPKDTVMGDPGLLAPLFHQPVLQPDIAGRTICIPHIHDTKPDEELLRISGADLVIRPSIAATEAALRDILNKIANAKFVLSGSLHGAIIACAYGRPFAYWGNGHVDIVFKWQDFAESVNITCRFVETVEDGQTIYENLIYPQLRLPPLTPILEVCPFSVRPSALLRALAYDGRLPATEAEAAAVALDALPSADLATVYHWQDESTRQRTARATFGNVLRRRIGKGKETLKRLIREVLRIT
jgi:hypothetical protein